MLRWFVLPVSAAVTLTALAGVSPPIDPVASPRAVEVARIQAHFDSVLAELNSAEVTGLTAAQRGRRTAAIATLAAYRDAARFPRNYDFPGQAVPYFVDRFTGIRCAVAHLLERTGREDIVARVAATNNNVWVAELAGDTALAGWLHTNGLTLAEAARIQVPYIEGSNPMVSTFGSQQGAYAVVAAGVTLPALATAWWNGRGNADGHRTLGTTLGFVTGALAIGVGTMALRVDGTPGYVAPLTLAAGGTTTWLSTRALLRQREDDARVARARDAARVAIAPVLPTRHSGTGLAVRLTF